MSFEQPDLTKRWQDDPFFAHAGLVSIEPAAEIARLREALNSFDAIDKKRNDALKTCMTLLENMHANRLQHKIPAYTAEIKAAMAQIKTCYDPHA